MHTRAAITLAALTAATVVAAAGAQRAAPRSGFDPAAFDSSVRPQDNLYRYVNGHWIDTTPVPDDRVSHTTATELIEKTNIDVRAIVEAPRGAARTSPGIGGAADCRSLRQHDERGGD